MEAWEAMKPPTSALGVLASPGFAMRRHYGRGFEHFAAAGLLAVARQPVENVEMIAVQQPASEREATERVIGRALIPDGCEVPEARMQDAVSSLMVRGEILDDEPVEAAPVAREEDSLGSQLLSLGSHLIPTAEHLLLSERDVINDEPATTRIAKVPRRSPSVREDDLWNRPTPQKAKFSAAVPQRVSHV
jgi:hypothetical protein